MPVTARFPARIWGYLVHMSKESETTAEPYPLVDLAPHDAFLSEPGTGLRDGENAGTTWWTSPTASFGQPLVDDCL